MTQTASAQNQTKGLEGVVVAQSSISFIDGKAGTLLYRGYNIGELSLEATYEEVAYLLWKGKLPNRSELDAWTSVLQSSSALHPDIVRFIQQFPKKGDPMAALRTAVSLMGQYDPDEADNSPAANERKGVRILSQIPSVIAAVKRTREGKEILAPQKGLSVAGNFIYMLKGTDPTPLETKGMNAYLILLADHELNASTFAARVTVGTLSDLHSAIVSAIGTLKGPLHGAANRWTMQMLLDIGKPERAGAYVKDIMDNKKKIMGFGHRVYKVRDPRANYLEPLADELTKAAGLHVYFEISRIVEAEVLKYKPLYVNVDFYSATLLYAMGIPVDFFTTLFAASRAAGWIAHCFEQYADNRLIRPDSEYIGQHNQTYVPIEKRS